MSATSSTHAGAAVLESHKTARTKTFFIWVGLSLLAFPLGGYVGWGVAGPVDGVVPALVGGALTGAAIGLAQWWMLRRRVGVGAEWIAATSAGLAIGLAVGAMAVGYGTSMSDLAIMGAISGASVGLAQGLVLRGKVPLWYVWTVAMPVFWTIGWVVMKAAGIGVEKQFTVFGLSGTLVFSILSGFLLISGLRRMKPASADGVRA